jgi:hypothetical protein
LVLCFLSYRICPRKEVYFKRELELLTGNSKI